MNRLLVCFHATADLDLLSESEWISGGRSEYIDTSYLKKTFNCYDESALELACRFADNCRLRELDCTCTAVTAAGKNADRFLETLAAVGFAQTDRIGLEEDGGWDALSSESLSRLLGAYIQGQESFDLILAGTQSADGSQGRVPLLLAELLDIRCITQVTDFRPADKRHAAVSYYRDDAYCEEIVSYPALLMIGNAADTCLRVPTLKQRMKSKKQPVTVYDPEKLRKHASKSISEHAVFCSMEPGIQKRDVKLIEGKSSLENAAIMYEYYRKWLKL